VHVHVDVARHEPAITELDQLVVLTGGSTGDLM
jgi:hypothetical protein